VEFFRLFNDAFITIRCHWRVLSRILVVPSLIYIGIDYVPTDDIHWSGALIFSIAGGLIYALIAIITHRVVLLGPNSVTRWGLSRWTNREFIFIAYGLGMCLLFLGIAIALSIPILFTDLPSSFAVILLVPIALWLSSRLSLVFPGIAIDRKLTFKRSWQLTRPYQLLMILSVGVLPILSSWLVFLLARVSMTFISGIAEVLILVLEIAVLSKAYRFIEMAEENADS
jgi:hypothetical protein